MPAFLFELLDDWEGVSVVFPGDKFFSTDGGFRDLLSGRMPGVACEIESFYGKGIACAKEGADVPEGTDVVCEEADHGGEGIFSSVLACGLANISSISLEYNFCSSILLQR